MSATATAPTPAPATTTAAPAVTETPVVTSTPAPAAAAAAAAPATQQQQQTPEPVKATEPPAAPAAPALPEKYELKVPEKSNLDPSYVATLETYAKENKLTNDQAQQILERDSSLVDAHTERLAGEYRAQVDSWKSDVMKDKDIGGDKFNESRELSLRAIQFAGGETLQKLLADSGYEFHPQVLKAFVKIGRAMSDDKIITTDMRGAGGPGSQKNLASKLYDNPTSQQKK